MMNLRKRKRKPLPSPLLFLCVDYEPKTKYEYWVWWRERYRYELMNTGISITEFACKYQLSRNALYYQLKCAGGYSGLIREFWDLHRRRFQRLNESHDITVDEYIARCQLTHKTAKRQLQQKPMDEYWLQHHDNYHRHYKPHGYSVAAYAKEQGLASSTARHYLCRFVDRKGKAHRTYDYVMNELAELQGWDPIQQQITENLKKHYPLTPSA